MTGVHVRPASRSTAERRPVVVGVDGSDSARHAADWAADVAAAWGVPLRLLHATPGPGPREDGDPRWLRELCDAAERAGVEEVDRRIVTGPVADELIEQSRAAAMVVVGSYGEGARSGMLAGSTALALVDGGGCPVAVIRGTAPQVPPPRRGPVVVGMDTGGDVTALHTGAKLAHALGARLFVLHAWSDVTEQGHGVHRSTASGTELAARALELVDGRVAPLGEAYPGLAVERHVVDDTALRALLDHASTARVVVVGHRRGRGAEGRLGSTGRGLVGFAACPVVVTRGAGRD